MDEKTCNNRTFGDRLKELRLEHNFNQAVFGEIMGEHIGSKRISSSAIGAYERNEREPTYELLRAFSEYFNVSIDYLMCTSDYRTTVEQYIAIDTHELEELLENYNVTHNGDIISGEQKRRLLDIATTLMWDN